jgi:hypothetical protein
VDAEAMSRLTFASFDESSRASVPPARTRTCAACTEWWLPYARSYGPTWGPSATKFTANDMTRAGSTRDAISLENHVSQHDVETLVYSPPSTPAVPLLPPLSISARSDVDCMRGSRRSAALRHRTMGGGTGGILKTSQAGVWLFSSTG